MAALNYHEAGNKLHLSAEDDHLIAGAFNYTEETESPFQNLDADTEELDIPHFVGDLRALMVDDSEDEVALDSDDEAILKKKQGKIRGGLWRHAQSVDFCSSAGSNLTDKVIDTERSGERNLVSNNENETGSTDTDTKCSKGDKFVDLNASLNDFEDANVVDNESQEPGESSEADALEFVDHFLSVSEVNSSPKVKIQKIDGTRSPFASCAKGSQKLAMKASFMTKIGVSTFDWDIDQPDHGGELCLEKKRELEIQRDEQLGGNERNEAEMFDVGFDTQMAAEAMEALLYATPTRNDANEHQQLKNPPFEKPSKKSTFPLSCNCDSQTKGISFNRKRVTKQRHQMPTSFHKHSRNQREFYFELPNIGKSKNCTNGDNLAEPKKKLHEKSLKVYKRKKQKEDSDKENSDNLAEPNKKAYEKSLKVYKRKKQKEDSDKENVRGSLLKPDKKAKTFSPVASRTRHVSSVKQHSKRTEDAICNSRFVIQGNKTVDVLHKRKMTDLNLDTWKWPKKKRTSKNTRQNAKLSSTFNFLSSLVKSGNCDKEGNFREAFLTSSVKRKARSNSIYRSTSRKKLVEDFSKQKCGEPSLVDVTNTKCVSVKIRMIPETLDKFKHSFQSSFSGEEKIKDFKSNGKNKTSRISELARLGFYESTPDFTSKDSRRRRRKVEIRVLFSQSLDDDVVKQQRKILRKLGSCMAVDCSDATHFVADRFARTKKMLEAMAFGKPIVTPLWLDSCEQAGCIIDERNYILRDFKKEKEIRFSMPVSLSRATTHPLLKDQRVFVTPNVKPDMETIKNLIKAVHGQVMEGIQEASMEYKTSDDVLILSCEQDYVLCVPFLDKGAAAYSSELLLNGIIIQKLEYAKHQLFKGHVIMKRYARKENKNGSQHLDVAHCG